MDKGNKKEKFIVQVVCLLLSIGLWFYVSNVENSTRTVNLDGIKVQLKGVEDLKDSGLALVANQSFTVDLKIEGQSSDIYKVNKEQFILEANLDDYALKKGENRIPVTLVNYPSSINIKNTNSLIIKVNIDEYKEKQVMIESELIVTTADGYYAETPILEKNELTISGPSTQVEKVEKAVIRGNIENISTDISKKFTIILVDKLEQEVKGVTLLENQVEVSIEVNKGKVVPIKVVTRGSLQLGKLKSVKPSKTQIEITGSEDIINRISEITTTAIDLATITSSTDIDVQMIIPDGIAIKQSNTTIRVSVEVEVQEEKEQLVDKEIGLKLTTKGSLEEFDYTLSSEEVIIVVSGYEKELESIDASLFTAEIDLSNLSEGEHEITPSIRINNDASINYEIKNKIKVTVSKI